MAEYQILHDEPRYKVDQWRNEMLFRRQDALGNLRGMRREMRQLLVDLARAMCARFPEELAGYFEAKWLKEGCLVIELLRHRGRMQSPEPMFGIDELVDDALTTMVPPVGLRDELRKLAAGLTDQFAAMKRSHQHLDLTQIRFRTRWLNTRCFVVEVVHHGRPLGPRDVGWDNGNLDAGRSEPAGAARHA